MAYQKRELSVLAYANGFTLWHYATPDSWDEVVSPGYFQEANEMLRDSDQIMVISRDKSGTVSVSLQHEIATAYLTENGSVRVDALPEKIRASVQNLDITDLSEVQILLNFGGSEYLMTCSNPKIERI